MSVIVLIVFIKKGTIMLSFRYEVLSLMIILTSYFPINSYSANSAIATTMLNEAVASYDSSIDDYISQGADINNKNDYNIVIPGRTFEILQGTPLHLSSFDDPGVTKKLLENNADPKIKDLNGNIPLHLAAKYGCRRAILYLLEADNNLIDDINNIGHTPLLLALINKHYRAATILLLKGANPNYVIANGFGYMSFLFLVADNPKLTKLFVNRGLNLSLKDTENRTLIHLAALWNRSNSLKYLLNHCIDINCIDTRNGNTALHVAAEKNNYKVIEVLLICSKINTEIKNNQGNTPLALAILKDNKESEKVLLNYLCLTRFLNNTYAGFLPIEVSKKIISYLPDLSKLDLSSL